jgi:predicted secreted protein
MSPSYRIAKVSLPLACFLAVVVPCASAQTPATLSDQTVLHLSETAQRDVPRDILHATLAAEASDADASKVQAAINQRMAGALARIKQVPDLTVETTGYSVYRDNPDKTPAQWHGSQSVTLTGKDFAALLGLVGTLQQQGLVMQNLAPDLSRDARQSVEDALTNEALTRLRERADRIATTLGDKVAGLRSVNVGNVNPSPPVFRAMAMAAPSISALPPVAEAGSATVSITVAADVALAPK